MSLIYCGKRFIERTELYIYAKTINKLPRRYSGVIDFGPRRHENNNYDKTNVFVETREERSSYGRRNGARLVFTRDARVYLSAEFEKDRVQLSYCASDFILRPVMKVPANIGWPQKLPTALTRHYYC